MRIFAFILVLLPAAGVFAQPVDVNRVLRNIDFEERRLGNPEELPLHWTKIVGQGFPHYVNAILATDQAHDGKYSFRFDLNGGSLAYRYDPGIIHVQSGAHYRVQTYVKTTVMPNARARLKTYFMDRDGHYIKSSLRTTTPYSATTANDNWKLLSLEIAADEPTADSLVIELELLQPEQYEVSRLGARELWPQDIHGTAWFDDVTVSQVPQVKITAERPGNIFKRGEALALLVSVTDRFTDDLAAQLIVRDASGKVVYQRSGAMDLSTAQTGASGEKKTRLVLPDLPPGWYEAALVMTSHGQLLARQTLDLIHLADDATGVTPDDRFGVNATDLPFEGWSELPQILPYLGVGRVKLAIWSRAGDIQQMDSAWFDQLLVRLQEIHVVPTACLLDLPPQVSARTHSGDWTSILGANKEDWQPDLAILIARHANHLDRWQLGADGSDEFATHKEMRAVYGKVYTEFGQLVQHPDLAMPWPAWYEMDGQLPATIALSVPPTIIPANLPRYVEDIYSAGKQKSADPGEIHELSLSLQWLDRGQYGREVQIRDLAQRVIYSLAANAKRIDLPLPFSVEETSAGLIQQPNELFMVVRTLVTTLSGATFKGKVPIADGVEAFLFDRDGQGILAIWDMGSAGERKQLALHLGPNPKQIDLWGNVTPLIKPNEEGARTGQVQLTIGPTPIFLVGVDGQLAQLRASVALDQPLIESSFQAHSRKIRFTSPFHSAVTGTLKLKAPPGWTLTPPNFSFSVNPGETFERELTIQFPYNSFSGEKTIEANFTIQADRAIDITVPLTLNLGLSDVGMQTIALRDGKDIVVQQIITNYGDKPIDYTAFATYPGYAREERLVSGLSPGKTSIKRYRFPKALVTGTSTVRVGVKEIDGTRVLNDQVEVQ